MQEPGKSNYRPFDHEMLDVYQLAIRWLTRAKIHVDRIPRGFRREADQLTSASNSIVRNISEGVGRAGNARASHYQIARGSAGECASSLDICLSWGGRKVRRFWQTRPCCRGSPVCCIGWSNRHGRGSRARAIRSCRCWSTSRYLVLRATCGSMSRYLVLRAACGSTSRCLALCLCSAAVEVVGSRRPHIPRKHSTYGKRTRNLVRS